MYKYGLDNYDGLMASYIALGIVALPLNAIVLFSEMRSILRKRGGTNPIVTICSFLGTIWVLTGVIPTAILKYDVYCDGATEADWFMPVSTACNVTKLSHFILISFVFAVGCSLSSFYFKLRKCVTFILPPKSEKQIYFVLIAIIPTILCIASFAMEETAPFDDGAGPNDKTGKIEYAQKPKGRLLSHEYDKTSPELRYAVLEKMQGVRSAFVCSPLLGSETKEIILLHGPLLLGAMFAFYFAFRTRKMLSQVIRYQMQGDRTSSARASTQREALAAKTMLRFAFVAALFVICKVAAMISFYPQLSEFADKIEEYSTCFKHGAFANEKFRDIEACLKSMGQYGSYVCYDIVSQNCENPMEKLPSVTAARMFTNLSCAMPLLFGFMFCVKPLKEAVGCATIKPAAIRPARATITEQSSPNPSTAMATTSNSEEPE